MRISTKIKTIGIGSVTTAVAMGGIGAVGAFGTQNRPIQLTSSNVAAVSKLNHGKKNHYSYKVPTVSDTQAITDGLQALHVTNPTNLSVFLAGNKQHVPMYHVSVRPSSPTTAHIAVVNGMTGATKVITPRHRAKNTYTTPKITSIQAAIDAEGAIHVSNPQNLRLQLIGTKKHVPIYRVFIKTSTTTKAQVVAVNGLTGRYQNCAATS